MKDRRDNYTSKLKSKNKLTISRILLLIIGGIAIGFVTGLFGGGGGMLLVPLLVGVGLLDEKSAHATSIAVILPVVISSMIVYLAGGVTTSNEIASPVVIGVLVGGLVGSMLLNKLSKGALRVVFYVVMISAGIRMMMVR